MECATILTPPILASDDKADRLFLMELLALTLKDHTASKQYETDQTHSVTSDLVLHCLPMSHKTHARLLCVKC